MFTLVRRNAKPGTFDPAILQRKHLTLVTPLPVLPASAIAYINTADRCERQTFNDKVFVCAAPAVLLVAALLGLYFGSLA